MSDTPMHVHYHLARTLGRKADRVWERERPADEALPACLCEMEAEARAAGMVYVCAATSETRVWTFGWETRPPNAEGGQ